jgi:DNA polymerase III epsilon subunit-like protein
MQDTKVGYSFHSKKPKKVLWIDTETTGLNTRYVEGKNELSDLQDVISVAGLIVVDEKVKCKFDLYCQPVDWDNIDAEALKINNLSIEKIETFAKPEKVVAALCKLFSKYVNPKEPDKFWIGGANCSFDIDSLNTLFAKVGMNKELGKYVKFSQQLDVLRLASYACYKGGLGEYGEPLQSYKLSSIAKALGIVPKNSHSALDDVITAYKVFKVLDKRIEPVLPF